MWSGVLTSNTDPTTTFCWPERVTPAAVLISVCWIPSEDGDGASASAAAWALAVSEGVPEAMVRFKKCRGVQVFLREARDNVDKTWDVDLGGMTCKVNVGVQKCKKKKKDAG